MIILYSSLHTHSFTPSGSISSHSHSLNSHTHGFSVSGTTSDMSGYNFADLNAQWNSRDSWEPSGYGRFDAILGVTGKMNSGTSGEAHLGGRIDLSHTHTFSFSGTTDSASGNTESTQPTFTGTAGTTSSNGSGTSFSILPPYVIKYCFERTA